VLPATKIGKAAIPCLTEQIKLLIGQKMKAGTELIYLKTLDGEQVKKSSWHPGCLVIKANINREPRLSRWDTAYIK